MYLQQSVTDGHTPCMLYRVLPAHEEMDRNGGTHTAERVYESMMHK